MKSWWRPLCWLLGHVRRWSPDDADAICRRCGKCDHSNAGPPLVWDRERRKFQIAPDWKDAPCPDCGAKFMRWLRS